MKKTEQIFDLMTVATADFRRRYNEANSIRKSEIKQLKSELVPGTPRYKAEQAQIDADFQASLTESRKKVLSEIMPELEGARQRAVDSLTVTDDTAKKLDLLKRFSDMPLSQGEINTLSEKYGGSYWTDRYISQLAERNNCEYKVGGAEIGEKLEALEQLEINLNTFLNGYSGEDSTSYEVRKAVSDNTIYGLEKQFTSNYSDVKLTPEQKAARAISICKSQPDFLSKSIRLASSYRNADVRTRQMILSMCADDDTMKSIVEMAGLDSRVGEFKENGLADMKAAIKAVNKAKQLDDVIEIAATLDEVQDNHFLPELLADALETTSNEHFRQAVGKSNMATLLRAKKDIDAETETEEV